LLSPKDMAVVGIECEQEPIPKLLNDANIPRNIVQLIVLMSIHPDCHAERAVKQVFLFRLTTLIDVKKTMEYLAYLGYMYEHDNQLSAIHGK